MAYRRISFEALAEELKKIGDEYDKESRKKLKSAVRKSGIELARKNKELAPSNAEGKWAGIGGAYPKRSAGTFRKSATSTFKSRGAKFSSTVHYQDPEYRLAHLLEDGHRVVHPITRQPMGKGFSEAFHFAEKALNEQEPEIIKRIEDAL